jgi:hypothetical protein
LIVHCCSEPNWPFAHTLAGFPFSSIEKVVGISVANFGHPVEFYLEKMMIYYTVPLITLEGTAEDGSPVHLIQNISQFSALLTPLKRIGAVRRPIGYHTKGTASVDLAKGQRRDRGSSSFCRRAFAFSKF